MKPAPFRYYDPRTLDEALGLLGTLDDARLLAGGQSFMPMMNMRVVQPAHVIDLNRIPELSYIRREGEVLEIGAMTRQRDIEFSDLVARVFPLLHEAVRHVGHRQTRNRGTLGGSLCQLDPSAELVTVSAAVQAEVLVASKRGRRTIPFAEFPAGLMTPAIEPDEVLTAVRFPLWKRGHGFAFEEFARRHGDFALASAAVLMEADHVSITVGGVNTKPHRLAVSSAAAFDEAVEACGALEVMHDVHVAGEYRRCLARALVRRALEKAHGRFKKN
jgi:carbon-monoxide dehydrogenase medium subunit